MYTRFIPITIYLFILSTTSFAQSYQITITNGTLIDDFNYEFDIVIKSTSGILELTSYQVSLGYHFINNSELKFSYINGTSELKNKPSVAIGILGEDSGSVLTFASIPGNEDTGEIDSIGENGKLIGRFIFSSTISLAGEDMFAYWNFSGRAATIITGAGFANITNPTCHFPAINGNHLDKSASNNTTGTKETVDKFELFQNYPNPFNPVTTIKYKVLSESFVQLKIFNVLGEEVRNLVNMLQAPGIHETKLNAEFLPSGYYIYCLYANNNIIDKRKMMLLK